jgi:dTDP-4-amino-4,6-dideoxygalactose transaminase
LRVLEQRVEQRREVFETYRRELADQPQINWMPEPEGYRSTRWLTCFTLLGTGAAKRRDAVLKSLERHSIEARPVWKPMHMQPVFRGAPYFPHDVGDAGDVGANLFEAGVCLPSGSNLTPEQQGRVVDQLRRALAEDRRAAA